MTPHDVPAEVFAGKAHRLTMGLRPLDPDTWLDADPADPQMSQRYKLLVQRREEVFAAVPGSQTACQQLAEAVAECVGRRLPGRDHPLVEAALLVRDDLCVLEQTDGVWRLTAAVVCFPSRWRLSDKLGRDVLSIHDPVPGYRETLGPPTERVFGSILRQGPRWRANWTLLDDPELFQPEAPTGIEHRPGRESFLRVERQCLVPVGEAIAFTIRTTVLPLSDLGEGQVSAVLDSARNTPADMAAYRGWAG